MEKEQIWAFAYRVATDTGYRAKLEQDPVGTLAELGITVDPAQLPPGSIQLPSNEEILAALEDFQVRVLCHTPLFLFTWFDCR